MTPIQKLKIKDPEYTNVIDLHIHKRIIEGPNGQPVGSDYFLYVVSQNGVLLYQQIEKKDDCKVLNEDWSQYVLTPNCADINGAGCLLVDAGLSK